MGHWLSGPVLLMCHYENLDLGVLRNSKLSTGGSWSRFLYSEKSSHTCPPTAESLRLSECWALFWYLSSLTTWGVPPQFWHFLFSYIPCLQICLLLTFGLYHNYWITSKAQPNLISFLLTKLDIPQALVFRELILEGLPLEVEHMGGD